MSHNLILITGLIYIWVAFEQGILHKNYGMLITYIGYAFANIGLYMLASKWGLFMKEPTKIKLTDSPQPKKINLIPLPSLDTKYVDEMTDDIYIKQLKTNENNQQNNSESIQ